MKKIFTYIKSLINRAIYAWNEGKLNLIVPSEIWQQRMALCRDCEHLENNGTYICGICECPIADKCRWASEYCSKKKNKKWFEWFERRK